METPAKKKGDFSKALDLMDDLPKNISYEEFCSILARRWAETENKAKAEEREKSN